MLNLFGNKEHKRAHKKLEILFKYYSYTGINSSNYEDFDTKFKYKKILSIRNPLPHDSGYVISDYENLSKTLDKVLKLNKNFNGETIYNLIPKKEFPSLPEKINDHLFSIRYSQYRKRGAIGELPIFITEIDELPYGNISKEELPDEESITEYVHKEINHNSDKRYIRKFAKDIHKAYEDYPKILQNRKNYQDYKNKYEDMKKLYYSDQEQDKKNFINIIDNYNANKLDDLTSYFNLILKISPYANTVKPKNVKFEYDRDQKILIISCELSDFEKIEVQYDKSAIKSNPSDIEKLLKSKIGRYSFERKLKPISQTVHKKLAEKCLYLVPIRMIYECFKFDNKNNLNYIALNGIVESFNKANGKLEKNNILSLFVERDKILEINIDKIDPKECFKSLKGVSAAKIYEYIPVTPILTFKKDKRVTKSKEILKDLKTEQNLAIMSWEDFEHLIRELFEKEFSQDGAEVKITQASRDKGVDAIAFDPDPIRGGKFIIQAKRYTSTVDVSAVRDLYGTIMNEGANRGILVSTAKYGGDSYEFIKNKPITLIEGNQLLGLLDKHGYKFKIDLKDARKILGLTQKKTY